MSAINEFQFELLPDLAATDGQVFGIGADISLNEDGFHPGATDWANQDGADSITGAVVFGRDVLNGPVWGWDLHVNRDDCPHAVESLGAFTTAWRARAIRAIPGAVIPLRYRLGGRTRRIFGRPGKIDPGLNNLLLSGYADITCDFQAVDGYTYDDFETAFNFDVGTSESGGSGGGFVFPLTFPYGPTPSAQQDNGALVGGTAPTSPIIRFIGPWTSPGMRTEDWTISFPDYELLAGQYIEVDTRPWANTILLNGQVSIAGALGRRQRLTDVRLEPGSLEFGILGSSSNGTGAASLRWSNAYDSL